MVITRFCKCGGYILTKEQEENNLPCDKCQEHAKTFKDRFEKLQKEEQDDFSNT